MKVKKKKMSLGQISNKPYIENIILINQQLILHKQKYFYFSGRGLYVYIHTYIHIHVYA